MTITQLEYILAVSRYKSFGKAAEACFVTQPTLSVQIQKLEEELGVVIFDRTKTPILVTEEGEPIIEQAKVILRESKRLKELAIEAKHNLRGKLKIAVIPTLSPYIIPLFAQNFAKKYPDIKLIIEEAKTDDIIKYLEDDVIDAGLLVTPLNIKSIIEKPLYYEKFYLFVSENHKLFKEKEISQDELNIKEIWLLNKGNCFRNQVLNICSETSQNAKNKDHINFESGNFETLKNMVLKTGGYTILPEMAVNQLPDYQKKYVREFKAPHPTREVSVVYSRNFYKKLLLDVLIKEISSSVKEEVQSGKSKDIEVINI